MVYNHVMKLIPCDNPEWMLFDCSALREDVIVTCGFGLGMLFLATVTPGTFGLITIGVGAILMLGASAFMGFSHHGVLINRAAGIATDWREVFGWRFYAREYPLNKFCRVEFTNTYQDYNCIQLIAISGDLVLGNADSPEDAHTFGNAIAEFLQIRYRHELLWLETPPKNSVSLK